MHCASELAVRIETNNFFLIEKVILWVAIHERPDRYHHQAFLAISHKHPGIDGAYRLFFVVAINWTVLRWRDLISHSQAQRIDPQRAGQRDGGGVLRSHISALPKRRNRSIHNSLGKALLIDIRDVIHLETIRAIGGVEIFPAQRQIEDLLPMMVVSFL